MMEKDKDEILEIWVQSIYFNLNFSFTFRSSGEMFWQFFKITFNGSNVHADEDEGLRRFSKKKSIGILICLNPPNNTHTHSTVEIENRIDC